MAGNTYGKLFKLITFGESHGTALGGVIDGCPSGITLDLEAIQNEMNRRKPGQSSIVTHNERSPTKSLFIRVYLKGKLQEHLLDLLSITPIKNPTITLILRKHIDPLTLIMSMTKSMEFAIIEEAVEVQLEKPHVA